MKKYCEGLVDKSEQLDRFTGITDVVNNDYNEIMSPIYKPHDKN